MNVVEFKLAFLNIFVNVFMNMLMFMLVFVNMFNTSSTCTPEFPKKANFQNRPKIFPKVKERSQPLPYVPQIPRHPETTPTLLEISLCCELEYKLACSCCMLTFYTHQLSGPQNCSVMDRMHKDVVAYGLRPHAVASPLPAPKAHANQCSCLVAVIN